MDYLMGSPNDVGHKKKKQTGYIKWNMITLKGKYIICIKLKLNFQLS